MESLFCAVLVPIIISCTLAVSGAAGDLPVLKGTSVHLNVRGDRPQQFYSIIWKFGSRRILEYHQGHKDPKIFQGYEDTAEFNSSTLSLLLKNVQLNDTGTYKAEIADSTGNSHETTHTLSIEEAPPKPQVGVTLLSSAEGVCIVSVNCSAEDFLVSHTCNHTHCTLVEKATSPSRFNLTVTATRRTINCSSSNRVGTETQTESTELICPSKGIRERLSVSFILIISVTCFIFLISIIIIVIYTRKRHNQGIHVVTKINTEYFSVENRRTVETTYDAVTTAKPERPLEGNTVYQTLGPPGDNSAKPETIYTTVKKSAA